MSTTAMARFDSARTAVAKVAGGSVGSGTGMQSSYVAMPGASSTIAPAAIDFSTPAAPPPSAPPAAPLAAAAAAAPSMALSTAPLQDQSALTSTQPATAAPDAAFTPFSSNTTPATPLDDTAVAAASSPQGTTTLKTHRGGLFGFARHWSLSKKLTVTLLVVLAIGGLLFFFLATFARRPAPAPPPPKPDQQELLVRLEKGSALELQGLPTPSASGDLSALKQDIEEMKSTLDSIEKGRGCNAAVVAQEESKAKRPPASAEAGSVRYSSDLATLGERAAAPERKAAAAGDAKWSSTHFYGGPLAAQAARSYSAFEPRLQSEQV